MTKRFKLLKYTVLTIASVFILGLGASCDDEIHEYLIRGYLYENPGTDVPVKNATLSFVFSTTGREIGTAKTDKRGRFAFRFQNEGYFKTTETIFNDRYDDDVDIDIYYEHEIIATYNTYDDGDGILRIYASDTSAKPDSNNGNE